MDIRDLRYFLHCVELGQVGLAAKRVGRTQPALTKAIRRLESLLDTRLFRSDGRGLVLTPMGGALATHARKVLRDIEEAVREVEEVAKGQIGHVRVGASPTAADWLLPSALRRALQEAPSLTFEVRVSLGEFLRRDLREGRLDFAIAPLLKEDHAAFTVSVLGTDTLVPAARPGHPLVGRKLEIADLAEVRWMVPTLTTQEFIRNKFERHNMPTPVVPVQVNTVVGTRQLVVETDLLTFISRRDLEGGTERGRLVEIDVPVLHLQREFGILVPNDCYVTMASRRLMEILSPPPAMPDRRARRGRRRGPGSDPPESPAS